MLSESEIKTQIGDMWTLHLNERAWLDRLYDYSKGLRGIPEVPEGALQEVKDIARLSVKNVLGMVRDSFAQNLSVIGYRRATALENDPAWKMWQRNRMDARQAEVYGPALTYGAAYVTVLPGEHGPVFRPRSPRQLLATYVDPQLDEWPQYALETWIDQSDSKPRRKGYLLDDEFAYPLDLGHISSLPLDPTRTVPISVAEIGEPIAHGAVIDDAPVCPVVRFVNARDADDMIVGEVAPLLTDQQAINEVNFDRLIVARFGAFPQRVITGWSGTAGEVLKASASRVWTFEDPEVKAATLAPASLEGYNALLEEMIATVAMKAQISPAQVVGKMVNLSADALAAAEKKEQRKLAAKREAFGESWEQVLRLGAAIDGDEETAIDSGAEVIWRDTEARSFGAVVDGLTKLANVGIPIDALLPMIPGMTQQQIVGVQNALRSRQVTSLVDELRRRSSLTPAVPVADALTG
ncbi:phage portal protein [Nocardia sp. NPDC057030]|uniref:phage portal protein n=1 Tax=unclassified Nocardia TaxID=2637762 RepID=UPI00363DC9B4